MTTITHYASDDLVIKIPVTIDEDAVISDLTGGAVTAIATDGFFSVTGAGTIDGTGLIVTVTFANDVFPRGSFTLPVRVTVGAVTQTVATIQINVS